MIYYASNERLLQETEQAEIQHAKSQPRIDRAKASAIGSPQAIVRLILSVLPIGALFLPLGRFYFGKATVNAVSMYKHISNMGFPLMLHRAAKMRLPELPLLCMIVCAVLILLHLFCLVASLGKHGKARNLILDVLILFSGYTAVFLYMVNHQETGAVLAWGAFVFLGLITALLICETILAKVGLPLKYTVCYIGGIPSDEYFDMAKSGVSELEIRKKMVEALSVMQEEALRKAAEEQDAMEKRRAARK